MVHLFCGLVEEFVLGEVGDEEEAFLCVHFLEGVFVAVDHVAADVEFFGGLCLVHARDCVDVMGCGFLGEPVFFQYIFGIHSCCPGKFLRIGILLDNTIVSRREVEQKRGES